MQPGIILFYVAPDLSPNLVPISVEAAIIAAEVKAEFRLTHVGAMRRDDFIQVASLSLTCASTEFTFLATGFFFHYFSAKSKSLRDPPHYVLYHDHTDRRYDTQYAATAWLASKGFPGTTKSSAAVRSAAASATTSNAKTPVGILTTGTIAASAAASAQTGTFALIPVPPRVLYHQVGVCGGGV